MCTRTVFHWRTRRASPAAGAAPARRAARTALRREPGSFWKGRVVEPLEQLGDRGVELGQREEGALAQRGQDPALDQLHRHLDLGLVARAPDARREHRHAVVAGQVLVGRVGVRLVAAGPAHRALQVVRHHQLGHAAEEARRRARASAHPVGQALRPGRLGVGVVRRAQHGDEDLRLAHLAGGAVDDRHRVPGVVDEQLLAGAVLLAHHHVEAPGPGPVALAEPAVLKPVRVDGLVLLPQQRQRHALAPQLPVHRRPVRLWARLRQVAPRPGTAAAPARRRPGPRPAPSISPAASARRRYSPTVVGEIFRLRAMARRLRPPSCDSRSTSRILRMDNLLFAMVPSPAKCREGAMNRGLSRVAQAPRPRPRAPFRCRGQK